MVILLQIKSYITISLKDGMKQTQLQKVFQDFITVFLKGKSLRP